MTREVATQLLGLIVLIIPLLAIQWNLAGTVKRRSPLLTPDSVARRWRLEIYSTAADAPKALADPADMPFPVKRVRSSKAFQTSFDAEDAWKSPRLELDVEVAEPFADDVLNGLLGTGYEVRFVSGDEAVVDARSRRLRIRALRFK